MSTTDSQDQPKEMDCQSWLEPAVDSARSLLYEVREDVGVPILVKNITTQEAINGARPQHLIAQG